MKKVPTAAELAVKLAAENECRKILGIAQEFEDESKGLKDLIEYLKKHLQA
jgi:hypothetical protein